MNSKIILTARRCGQPVKIVIASDEHVKLLSKDEKKEYNNDDIEHLTDIEFDEWRDIE